MASVDSNNSPPEPTSLVLQMLETLYQGGQIPSWEGLIESIRRKHTVVPKDSLPLVERGAESPTAGSGRNEVDCDGDVVQPVVDDIVYNPSNIVANV